MKEEGAREGVQRNCATKTREENDKKGQRQLKNETKLLH